MSTVRETVARIDAEIESIKQTRNYAIVARHDILQKKMEILSAAYDELEPLIGPDNTVAVLSRAMDRMKDAAQEAQHAECETRSTR